MREYIKLLGLQRHIEGGYFSKVYESTDRVKPMSSRYASLFSNTVERSAGTSIYFLLSKEDFSAWHILKSDEIWHYYDGGSPLAIHTIDENGRFTTHLLGNPRLTKDASFQVTIKAGWWFAAEVVDKKSYGLVGCTVAPGFEYQDFQLAEKEELIKKFPQHEKNISKFIHSNHVSEKIRSQL